MSIFSLKRPILRRWGYGLLSLLMAATIIISTPKVSYGQSWVNLLLQGLQVIQLSSLSDRQEVNLGQQINQQLLRSRNIRIVSNPDINAYVNSIGQRLAQASARPTIPYKFQVVNDKSVNAFATMGGFVYVNTGLMQAAANEAELASVIAHEIGHIAGRHSINQMRDVALSQGLMSAAGLRESTMVQLGVQLAVNLPNSREAELEADRMGLTNLIRAGYAPAAMVSFMKKLGQQGGSPPAILSTHPANSERVNLLAQSINPATAYQGDGLDSEEYRLILQSFQQKDYH
jgi:predicted Zn-dependent protease